MKKSLCLLFLFLLAACASDEPKKNNDTLYVLRTISAPEYEGRGVGTKGLDKARDFLVQELKAKGFQGAFLVKDEKGNLQRSFTQDFRVFIGNELGAGNSFADSNAKDFVPYAFSKNGSVKNAPLAFVGFGITLRDGKKAAYDDYAGLDVKNKIVVALLGDPALGAKKSVFRDPSYFQYATPLYKVQNAERHGAIGVILVRDPLSLSSDVEPSLQFFGRQGGGTSFEILAGQARIDFAESLLGKSLRECQEKIVQDQKPHSFLLHKKKDLTVSLQRTVGVIQNVGIYIPGSNPALAKKPIVIGAHYDHLGYGGDSSMDPSQIGKIHPGADDNASGVQAVFDLAQRVANYPGHQYPVLALFFSGEEIGLLGSKYFVENLPLADGSEPVLMLNLDMVGRLRDNKLTVFALRSAKSFASLVDNVNESFHFNLIKGDSGSSSSDQTSFLLHKVPSLFFTTGSHEDYHRPSDTAAKIKGEGVERVEDFIFELYERLDDLNPMPAYVPGGEELASKPRIGRGYGVYFGSIPEFTDNGGDGVHLQGVRPNSPAEKAGMKAGDILTALGGIQIKNLYDFVFALRFYRANEKVTAHWLRGGVKMEAQTKLLSRDEQ